MRDTHKLKKKTNERMYPLENRREKDSQKSYYIIYRERETLIKCSFTSYYSKLISFSEESYISYYYSKDPIFSQNN
jgi:hypothetical protein